MIAFYDLQGDASGPILNTGTHTDQAPKSEIACTTVNNTWFRINPFEKCNAHVIRYAGYFFCRKDRQMGASQLYGTIIQANTNIYTT